MKRLLTASIAALLTLGASAQSTQRLTANKVNEYGLIYALPTTTLDITIEAVHTVKQPGEYYKYARKYLNADPITEPSESWTVKSVTITPRGVADTEEQYLMQFKSGSTPFLVLSADNLPLAINAEALEMPTPKLPVAVEPTPTPLQTEAARQVVTEEMMQSQSTAKRAELAAAQIYALRQSRTDLITGQAEQMPPDGAAMQLIIDNINAQEAALTAMFLGTEQQSTAVKTISYTPAEEVTKQVIARISAIDGIVPADDLSGDPVYLTLSITERGELPVNEKGEVKRFPKGGVAYRIPGSAAIDIAYDGQLMASAKIAIAQYGVVFGLNPSIFTDKKAPAYLHFDPTTGAIIELGTIRQGED